MGKQHTNKKKKVIKRVVIAAVSVIAVIVIGAGIYWFSMPKEQRNMLWFMVASGESYDSYLEYQVIDRNEGPLAPTSFEPIAAVSSRGEDNMNIAVITEMVKNDTSSMMKKGNVQTIGVDDYTGWHLLADEGAAEGVNPYGPSPLSYYTSGLAANLHTQIIKAAEVTAIELDNVKVEVSNAFRWDDMISEDGAGHLDVSTINIIIESSASKEAIGEMIDIAMNGWAAGEALKNETVIEPALVVNGDNWDTYRSVPGSSSSDESVVDELILSSVTDLPRVPEYLEQTVEEEDESLFPLLPDMSNMRFDIFAISESAGSSERPYLKRITLSTPSAETWEIYSDEFMGDDDMPVAPTSLEYFTAGTALCLTSQTTLVGAMMGLEFTEYRVENQTDYRQEHIGTPQMESFADTVHSYILIESEESQERLEAFYNKSLSLCFAGEGLKNATDMDITLYVNGDILN